MEELKNKLAAKPTGEMDKISLIIVHDFLFMLNLPRISQHINISVSCHNLPKLISLDFTALWL